MRRNIYLFQNEEFQVYTPEQSNIYTKNGYLYIKPVGTMLFQENKCPISLAYNSSL